MPQKNCEIYEDKICDNCGDCEICDLDPNKKCDNCGKCIEGFDYTGIQVDDLVMDFDDKETADEYSGVGWKFDKQSSDKDDELDDNILYIDDIEGLGEEIEHHLSHHHLHDHDHDNCNCSDHNHDHNN